MYLITQDGEEEQTFIMTAVSNVDTQCYDASFWFHTTRWEQTYDLPHFTFNILSWKYKKNI